MQPQLAAGPNQDLCTCLPSQQSWVLEERRRVMSQNWRALDAAVQWTELHAVLNGLSTRPPITRFDRTIADWYFNLFAGTFCECNSRTRRVSVSERIKIRFVP